MTAAGTLPLELLDVTLRYGEVLAVDSVSFEVPPGSLTALVGPSGCGKTSLLRLIAGFEPPAGGSVSIAGRVVANETRWVAPERRAVGMVFQQGALFPHLTVDRNVRYGVIGRPNADRMVAAALDRVGIASLSQRYPDELSGGQQQRVALARALAPAPEIVLLDEPFANLDAATRRRVRDEVAVALRDAGATAVFVTHDQEEALSVADRVAVMIAGRILQVGSAEEIYRLPRTAAVADFIGGGQLLPCEIHGGRLRSALGPARCNARDGGALLLVRPEDLELRGEDSKSGTRGRILDRQFFGHDLLHGIRLESGEIVQVRSSCDDERPTGTLVSLRLREKAYEIFSRQGDGESLGRANRDD